MTFPKTLMFLEGAFEKLIHFLNSILYFLSITFKCIYIYYFMNLGPSKVKVSTSED